MCNFINIALACRRLRYFALYHWTRAGSVNTEEMTYSPLNGLTTGDYIEILRVQCSDKARYLSLQNLPCV